MHIPENYLSPSTCALFGAAMVPLWRNAVRKVKLEVSKKRMPLLGIGAAFSFLIMMFNIPLPGGTTGHAAGAALIAILLGPSAACISVTIALLLQAVLFGDGGILAFGANSFNIAFIMPFSSYYIYKFIKGRLRFEKGEYFAVFASAYISLNLAALFTAIEFGVQPLLFKDAAGLPLYCPYGLNVAIPAMVLPHLAVAGFVEGIVTLGVYTFIKKVSPGIIYEEQDIKSAPIYGLLVTMIILSPLGLLAAGTAWGEWGIDEIQEVVSKGKILGFTPKGMEKGFAFSSLIPDYALEGIPEVAAYILSAVAGTAILLIFFKLILSRKGKNNSV